MEPRSLLITGAGQRIGRALALQFGAQRCAVAVHYNGSAENAEQVAHQIVQTGGRATTVRADLADPDAVERMVHKSVQQLECPLSALINNASMFEFDTWTDWTIEQWDRQLDVNLRAPAQLMRCFAAQDLASVADPAILNIIDQRVWNLSPNFTTYTISKAALWAATQTAAQGLAPHIRVNAIGPGPVLQSVHQTVEAFQAQCCGTPLERGTNPEEIYQAARFLLASPAMTGQMIALDGGEHLDWRTASMEHSLI